MITGIIKNKVDKIWTDIWAGGITNPITVIEQLTYLMFIRSLDEKELESEEYENMLGSPLPHIFPASEAGQSMRWSRLKNSDPRVIFDTMSRMIFPAIKKLKNGKLPDFSASGEMIEIEGNDDMAKSSTAFARYMEDAMFLIPTPQVLQKIITGLEDLNTHDIADRDMQGDLYEYAKTQESITPDASFSLDGNRFSVKTLDLNTNFKIISRQLDAIAESLQ